MPRELSDEEFEARAAQLMTELEAGIAVEGWWDTGVFPTEDAPGPNYNYTTGFYKSWDHPELIIAGLDPDTAHRILGSIAREVAAGLPVVRGRPITGILASDTLHLRARGFDQALAAGGVVCSVTNRYYGRRTIPYLQIEWPDTEGRFPGDEGMDPGMEAKQAIGGRP